MANSNENGRGGSSSNFDERLMRDTTSCHPDGIVDGGAPRLHGGLQRMEWNSDDRPAGTEKHDHERVGIVDGIICTDAGALYQLWCPAQAFTRR